MRVGLSALVASAFLIGTACPGAAQADPAGSIFDSFGTGFFFHPIQQPSTLVYPQWCADKPYHCCKEKVYVFGVDGFNPLCYANFNGMCGYLRQQGFVKTYYGQLNASYVFANKICDIREYDKGARIALIGFSIGANEVRTLANDLARKGVKIDLVVYLAGDFVDNRPSSFPTNVSRVVNLRAHGLVLCGGDFFFNRDEIPGAVNRRLNCGHMLTPSRRETVELLMEELLALACEPGEAPAPGDPK